MNLVKTVTLCILMMASTAFAGTNNHPIDLSYEKCIAQGDASTSGVAACNTKAIAAWDKELNKNYKTLMQKFDKKQKGVLKSAQRAWLKFRDSEMAFERSTATGGTFDALMQGASYLEMEKQRALSLKSYVEGIGEGNSDEVVDKPKDIIKPAEAVTAASTNSIDLNYDKCIAKSNGVTASMHNCTIQATTEWDKALNKNYKALMQKSNKKQKEALKTAQRAWMKFRDSEMEFERTTATGGTFDALMQGASYLEMEKQRTLKLRSHLQGIGEE